MALWTTLGAISCLAFATAWRPSSFLGWLDDGGGLDAGLLLGALGTLGAATTGRRSAAALGGACGALLALASAERAWDVNPAPTVVWASVWAVLAGVGLGMVRRETDVGRRTGLSDAAGLGAVSGAVVVEMLRLGPTWEEPWSFGVALMTVVGSSFWLVRSMRRVCREEPALAGLSGANASLAFAASFASVHSFAMGVMPDVYLPTSAVHAQSVGCLLHGALFSLVCFGRWLEDA